MRSGPKAAGSTRALPAVAGEGVEALAAWSERWIRVPRGTGAGGPLVLRPFQRAIAADVLDPEVRLTCWVCGRGNAKSATASVLSLHHITEGPEGATAAVVATDERAAARVLKVATRMVETSPSLSKRVTIYADRLVCERTGGEMLALPAEYRRIEGGDFSALIVDEVGLVERPVWEAALLSLKREGASALAIGTPSPPAWRDRSPLLDLVTAGRVGDDPTLRLHEWTSDLTHPVDCDHCARAANPGYGDILDPAQVASSLPPKTRESEYRRARLSQWVTEDGESWLPPGAWADRTEVRGVPDGADVVLSLDGSFSQDATGLLVAQIGAVPHLDVVGLWEAPEDDPDYRVDVLAVEAAVLAACKRWRVREVAADPYRWQRSLQVLARDGVPVVEFPQSASRMSPATTNLREAVLNGTVTHSGDADLARHVGNAVLRDDARGVRLAKASKHSRRRIDLAVCAVMAHARAQHRAAAPAPKRMRFAKW